MAKSKSKSKSYRLLKKYINCQENVTKIQNQLENISNRLNSTNIGTTKYTKIESTRNRKLQILDDKIHKLHDANEKLAQLNFIIAADEVELPFLETFLNNNPGWNGKIYPDISCLNQLQREALVLQARAFNNFDMVDPVNYEDINDDKEDEDGDGGGGDDNEDVDEDEDEDEDDDEGNHGD